MTLRDRIADWISGGALSEAREDYRAERAAFVQADTALAPLRIALDEQRRISSSIDADLVATDEALDRMGQAASDWRDEAERLTAALAAIIAAGDTANPNSTVRRMVRIAREAIVPWGSE